jgi:hypothetical protein
MAGMTCTEKVSALHIAGNKVLGVIKVAFIWGTFRSILVERSKRYNNISLLLKSNPGR